MGKIKILKTIMKLVECRNSDSENIQKKLLGICDESVPALNHLDDFCGRQRRPLRDKDRLGNDSK